MRTASIIQIIVILTADDGKLISFQFWAALLQNKDVVAAECRLPHSMTPESKSNNFITIKVDINCLDSVDWTSFRKMGLSHFNMSSVGPQIPMKLRSSSSNAGTKSQRWYTNVKRYQISQNRDALVDQSRKTGSRHLKWGIQACCKAKIPRGIQTPSGQILCNWKSNSVEVKSQIFKNIWDLIEMDVFKY